MNRKIAAWTAAGALALSVGLVGVTSAAAAPIRSAPPGGAQTKMGAAHRSPVKTMPAQVSRHGVASKKSSTTSVTATARSATPQAAKGKVVSSRAMNSKGADRGDTVRGKAALARDRAMDKRGHEAHARSATA